MVIPTLSLTPTPRPVIVDMADHNLNEHEDELPVPHSIYESFWSDDLTHTPSFFNSELGVDLSATLGVEQQGVGPSTGRSWSENSHTRDVQFGQSQNDSSKRQDQSIQQPSQRLITGKQHHDDASHTNEHGSSATGSQTDTYVSSDL